MEKVSSMKNETTATGSIWRYPTLDKFITYRTPSGQLLFYCQGMVKSSSLYMLLHGPNNVTYEGAGMCNFTVCITSGQRIS